MSGSSAPAHSTISPIMMAPVLPSYARQDVTFVRGEGAWLEADDGSRYLDLVAGIAVVGLGHCHPAPLAAAKAQLERLWHVSNLYWTEPMAALADRLSQRFGGAQTFFCNSGAEAVEAGLKYARKATGKPGFVALEGSFHGRTLGALSVTGQPAKRTAFEPLVAGASFARLNDVESLVGAARPNTGAILLEPVQGEGGVNPATPEFLAAARTLADELGALLVFDEVQTGVGRTGTFFCFEQAGIRPDAVTLAKGLANGLPIGALVVADDAAGGFVPGDHASTFGGNPVACAAACAVCDELTDRVLAEVQGKSARLAGGLSGLPGVREVRGLGLLLAAELDRPAGAIVSACLERGLLVTTAGENVLRLTPPLTISAEELDLALATLAEVLAE
jgi:predicted acetylornithine/succinylornithine family transaminase